MRKSAGRTGLVISLFLLAAGLFATSSSQEKIPIADSLSMGAIGHRGHVSGIRCAVFSQDGKRLATAGWDRTFYLWDLEKGTLIYIIQMEGLLEELAMSRDGRFLAVGGGPATQQLVYVFDAGSGDLLWQFPYDAEDLTFSLDGATLFAAGYKKRLFDETERKLVNIDESIVAWNAASGEETGHFSRTNFTPSVLTPSPDGQSLAVAALNSGMWLFPVSLSGEPRRLTDVRNFVSSIVFTPSGDRIAYSCMRDSAGVIDVRTGARIAHFPDSTSSIFHARFTSDSRQLVTFRGIDQTLPLRLSFYDLETLQPKHEIKLDRSAVIGFTPGLECAVLQDSGAIQLLDLQSGAIRLTIPGEPQTLNEADGFPLRLISLGQVQRSDRPPEGCLELTNEPSREYWRIDVQMENHGSKLLELTSPSTVQIIKGTFREKAGLGTLLLHNKGKEGFPLMYVVPMGGGKAEQSLVVAQSKGGFQQEIRVRLVMQPHERVAAGLVFVVPKKKKEKDFQLQMIVPHFRVRLPSPPATP